MPDSTLRQPIEFPKEAQIAAAVEILRRGELVAFPTETVYGLGADARSDAAVAKIYAAKGRPAHNPLIAHVADWAAALRIAEPSATAAQLAEQFWPGPLTLVLPARAGAVSPQATAGLPTIALRAPDHPIAQALLRAFDGPLVAPSANRSGRLSPTRAEAVQAELAQKVAMVLDGGPCRVGVESTILKLTQDGAQLLRPGGLSIEALEAALGAPITTGTAGKVEAPGMLSSHYAPRATLRLNAASPDAGEAWLGFGPDPSPPAPLSANLSRSGDLAEAAQCLFATLRQLDADGADKIAVAPIPNQGLGRAINDRLRRAAAPRG
ncbi:MAG: threonylcarbamoyl-AMP synthase [Neomegalonema sp.]|nr:threonylcarbamoyl-AMP synthase [Neomegalonema sp.]